MTAVETHEGVSGENELGAQARENAGKGAWIQALLLVDLCLVKVLQGFHLQAE